jgi:hypothetical protein
MGIPIGRAQLLSFGDRVAELLEVLSELLAALIHATGPHSERARQHAVARHVQTIGWLRPLVTASVKLELTVRPLPVLDTTTIVARCDDLLRLLTDSRRAAGGGFAERYVLERALSPPVAKLHKRVVAACRRVAGRSGPVR